MNAMYPLDLLEIAERLIAPPESGELNQADLRSSIHISCHAVYSAGCENVADCLIGTSKQARSSPAWRRAYRSVDPGYARSQCNNTADMERLAEPVRLFGKYAVELQEMQGSADYDPSRVFSRREAKVCAEIAREAIMALQSAPLEDRVMFSTLISMRNHR